jgi:phytoene synthase
MDSLTISQAHAAASDFVRQSPMMRITSMFFTPEHRRAAHAMYAFFRTADNLVDEGHVSLEQFREWRKQSQLPIEKQTDPFMIAWADIRAHYGIDLAYEQAVLDGLELDLTSHRYETLDELKKYCYGVTVAPFFLSMLIVGFRPGVTLEQARPYIESMGTAIQLTDIIRDVDDDLNMGRIYLPKSELAAFDLTYADIEARRDDDRFKRFMRHFTNITKDYYQAGWPILNLFPDSFRLAGGSGLVLNRLLLGEIEKHDFQVFPKLKIPLWKRFSLLAVKWPAIYWPESADRYF